jgi:hypothetical protein
MDSRPKPPSPPSAWPGGIVRLAGLWILAGALLKLLLGNPADLPRPLLALPLGAALTFKLAIGVEFAVAALALLRPALGWPLVVLLLVAFGSVLGVQVADGAKSCGCFGASIEVPPWAMLAADSVLLVLVLLSRPWRLERHLGPAFALALTLVLAGLVAPWVFDREAKPGAVRPGRPAWVVLEVARWQGRRLEETPLGEWLDLTNAPRSGVWVLYRNDCEVCAEHLQMMSSFERGQRDVVLVRLPKAGESGEDTVVHTLPEGEFVHHLVFPEGIDWSVEAPAQLEVEDGVIRLAAEGVR